MARLGHASSLLCVALAVAACQRAPQGDMVDQALNAVRTQLLAPDSARFFDVRAYPVQGLVCGRLKTRGRTGHRGFAGIDAFTYRRGAVRFGSDGPIQFWPEMRACMEAEARAEVAGVGIL